MWTLCQIVSGPRVAVLLLSLALGSTVTAQTVDEALSCEIEPEDFWTYRVNDLEDVTITVLPEIEEVNGVLTNVIKITGGELSGSRTNVTCDEFGDTLHRQFLPDLLVEGVGFLDFTTTYTPPIKSSNAVIQLGDVVQSDGDLLVEATDGVHTIETPGTYSSTVRFAFLESVSVPFGTFDAIQAQSSVTQTFFFPDQTVSVTVTGRDWIVSGIGSVRFEVTEGGETDTFELINTNREFVPEPSQALLAIVALLTVAALARLRRDSRRW